MKFYEKEYHRRSAWWWVAVAAIIFGVLILAILEAIAAPKFVTKQMMKRNGLTDEQYEFLWKQGRNPQIDTAAARDWVFRASRYTNVVDWLETCGASNDFAKLSHKLQGENFTLKDLNSELNKTNSALRVGLDRAIGEIEILTPDAEMTKAIRKAAGRTEKNLKKVIKTLEQAKKKAAGEDEEALWTSLIAILSGAQPNA